MPDDQRCSTVSGPWRCDLSANHVGECRTRAAGSAWAGRAMQPSDVNRAVASADTIITALLQRVGGQAAFTANELARAERIQTERRWDGYLLQLYTKGSSQ